MNKTGLTMDLNRYTMGLVELALDATFAINTPTKEDFELLMSIAGESDMEIDILDSSLWDIYESDTCVSVETIGSDERDGFSTITFMYSPMDFYIEEEHCQILKYDASKIASKLQKENNKKEVTKEVDEHLLNAKLDILLNTMLELRNSKNPRALLVTSEEDFNLIQSRDVLIIGKWKNHKENTCIVPLGESSLTCIPYDYAQSSNKRYLIAKFDRNEDDLITFKNMDCEVVEQLRDDLMTRIAKTTPYEELFKDLNPEAFEGALNALLAKVGEDLIDSKISVEQKLSAVEALVATLDEINEGLRQVESIKYLREGINPSLFLSKLKLKVV